MRAFTLDSFDTQPAVRADIAEPAVGDRELLVRVHASSVNPVDVFIAGGALKEMAEHEFPVILGRDYAGVVDRIGSGVGRYRVGEEVFGFLLHANPVVHDGSWAELIAVPEDNFVAAKPRSLDFAEAGAAAVGNLGCRRLRRTGARGRRDGPRRRLPGEWAASSCSSPPPQART
ncbi:MAG: alcohol dehydrogenase catalytic domain-containing protein [Actinobacteria bacterium]|nr:alcohol dehydrogenase catalytic domain-containing protein [Actinomycetota bacterium]